MARAKLKGKKVHARIEFYDGGLLIEGWADKPFVKIGESDMFCFKLPYLKGEGHENCDKTRSKAIETVKKKYGVKESEIDMLTF
jgi:hypothetical protein